MPWAWGSRDAGTCGGVQTFGRLPLISTDVVTQATVADLNLDGRPEVVSLSDNGTTLKVFSSSLQGIRLSLSLPLGTPINNLVVADFVGDSRPEIALLDSASGQLRLLTQTPVGLSVAWSGPLAGAGMIGVLRAHSDGGVSSLVVAQSRSAEVSLLRVGSTQGSRVPLPFVPQQLSQADIDGDGLDELVAFESTFNGSRIGILDASDGGLSLRMVLSAGNATHLLPLDVDHDGDDDLVVGLPVEGNTFYAEDGGLRPPASLFTSPTTDLFAADIDGDGRAELATATSNHLLVQQRSDAGYWTTSLSRELEGSGRVLGAGDLNLDGRRDLVVASRAGLELFADSRISFEYRPNSLDYAFVSSRTQIVFNYSSPIARQGKVELLRGLTDGGLSVVSTLSGSFFPAFPVFAVGDVNADGHPDIVMGGDSDLGLSLNARDGGLTPPLFYNFYVDQLSPDTWNGRIALTAQPDVSTLAVVALTDAGLTLERAFALPTYALSIQSSDVDGDGREDLVVLCQDGVTVLRGLPDGGAETYGSQLASGRLQYGSMVLPTDLDGDGASELVVLDREVQISILKRIGAQWVTVGRYPPGPQWPFFLVAGDFDGDGYAEIVESSWGTRELFVLSPNGNYSVFPAPNSHMSPIIALDVDSNGRSELVTRGLWVTAQCAPWQ